MDNNEKNNEIHINDTVLKKYVNSSNNTKNYDSLKKKIEYFKKNNKALAIKLALHPCSGKTYFYNKNKGYYNNIYIYDFDNYLINDKRRSRLIFNDICINKHSCILGAYENIDKETYIIDISIVIPYSLLLNYHKKRLLYTKDINNKWNNITNIINSRSNLLTKSIENEIPIFLSIESGLDYIIKCWINE